MNLPGYKFGYRPALATMPGLVSPYRSFPWAGIALVIPIAVSLIYSPVWALFALATLGAFALSYLYFEPCLLFLLFLLPFSYQFYLGSSSVLTLDLLQALIIPIWILRTDLRGRVLLSLNKQSLTIILFFIYTLATFPFRAVDSLYTGKLLVHQFLGIGLCLGLVAYLSGEKQLKAVLKVLFVTSVVMIAYGIYQMYIQDFGAVWYWMNPANQFLQNWYGRAYSLSNYPNNLAGYLNIVLGLALGLLFYIERWRTRLLFLCLGLILLQFMTFSRGGWIATAAMFLLLLLVKRRFGQAVLLLILGGGLLWFFSSNQDIGRVAAERGTEIEPEIIATRMDLFLLAEKLYLENPVIGIGFGNFAHRVPSESVLVSVPLAAHNLYLQILAESGIVGACGFLVPLALLLISCLRAEAKNPLVKGVLIGCSCALVSVFAHGSVDYLFETSASYVGMVWTIIGISCAALRLVSEENFSARLGGKNG